MSDDLRIGDHILDNDKRMGRRRLRIHHMDEQYVFAVDSVNRSHRILRRRIKPYPKSSGFTLEKRDE